MNVIVCDVFAHALAQNSSDIPSAAPRPTTPPTRTLRLTSRPATIDTSSEVYPPTPGVHAALENGARSSPKRLLQARDPVACESPSHAKHNSRGPAGKRFTSRAAELFNPATDTFTKLTGAGQSLTEARWFAVAATLPSGQVLLAGGKNGDGFMSSAELFVPAAQAEIAGGSFGKRTVVGHSAVARLSVMSVGTQGLSISGVTLAGANAADFTVAADSCKGAKLAFGESCTISMTFTPSGKGLASATLALNDNESEPATLRLSATGIAATHRTPARKVGHGRKRRHQRHHPTKKRRAKSVTGPAVAAPARLRFSGPAKASGRVRAPVVRASSTLEELTRSRPLRASSDSAAWLAPREWRRGFSLPPRFLVLPANGVPIRPANGVPIR